MGGGVFKWGGTKLESFFPKNQHTQRKLLKFENWISTVEHGQIITENFLGEHKVITAEQQFLALILCFLCI